MPLHAAVWCGHKEVLLGVGGDICVLSEDEKSVVDYALMRCYKELARYLEKEMRQVGA